MDEILSQGAEAILVKKGDRVFKERVKKSYRLTELDDKLRASRTKREAKVFQKLVDLGIRVPELFPSRDKYILEMEFLSGMRLRDRLLSHPEQGNVLIQIGKWIAKMHDEGIIHGDLTTSNIMITPQDELILIDFGLSFFSEKPEDKAVDIHLLKQALESTHYQHAKKFYAFFKEGYSESSSYEEVLTRLDDVEKRGRNKH